MDNQTNIWFEEECNGFCSQRFRIKKTLFSGKSKYQKIDIFESIGHGKILVIDGFVMLTERDEFIYHEMISHVPIFTHPNPRKVLVIGGGDGGTAREVLRHRNVEFCTMVEIDEMVVEVCKKFLPITASELDNERLNLIIDDGIKFVAETEERFDVVIIDSTDPIGPAEPLFGKEFYCNVNKILNDPGIVVAQGESPFYDPQIQVCMLKNQKESFPGIHMYNFANLSYPGGFWTFTFSAKGVSPLKDFDEKKVLDAKMPFKYYNSSLHKAAFALPQFMLDNYKDYLTELIEP
ncbi:polyamine aminopropyltransferase [Candidatus Riflebacteria bacterium]